ncbi:unnamed protein product [Mytilus coruscus]|uniref:Uncharacterized protein n=1 Tax=Mytilus coruscus TaxID=42192 RepID=A0A6J8AWQ3_MYTCO|nr:unnamed protein product [Mytilus coruscus]
MLYTYICVVVGQASGNYFHHNGGGVNNLCLPNDPENGEHQPYANSQIFGAEYMIHPSRKQHGMSGNLEFREVPCVVCRRERRSSVEKPAIKTGMLNTKDT